MNAAGGPQEASVLIARGAALTDLGRWPEAIGLLGRAVAIDPSSSTAWCEMARAQLGSDQPGAALSAAGRAAGVRPDDEWPHRLASIALDRLGRRGEAVTAARTAVRCGPALWQTHVRLATVATSRGERAERAAAVRRALELAPEEPTVHVVAGALARDRGRRREAISSFQRALALDPQNSVAHHELARARLPRWRSVVGMATPTELASAASGFASAVRADPRSSVSRDGLDLVTRAVLRRTCLVVGVSGLITSVVVDATSSPFARAVPLAGAVVAALGIAGYARKVPAAVRGHLVAVARTRHRLASVLLVLAAAGLVLCVFVPRGDIGGAASASYAGGLLASVVVRLQGERSRRRTNRVGRGRRR